MHKTTKQIEEEDVIKNLENPKISRRRELHKKITHYTVIGLILFFTIYGVIFLTVNVGYVWFHEAKAGYITELDVIYKEPAYNWAGFYGVSLMAQGYNNLQYSDAYPAGMNEINLIFPCFERGIEHEVYASHVDPSLIDWNSLQPATVTEIDSYLGLGGSEFFSAQNTYTQTTTLQIGGRAITAPATYTKQNSTPNSTTFATMILKDNNNNMVIATKILAGFTYGFNGRIFNYQLLVPVSNNSAYQRYYFYADPYDECPEGIGTAMPKGYVIGNVSDNLGNRITDVIVTVGGFDQFGSAVLTDATGGYNVSSDQGLQMILAIKAGFEPYNATVNITAGNTTVHNIILTETRTQIGIGPGVGPGIGPGVGPGQSDGVGPGQNDNPDQDVGPGIGPGVGPYVEQPKEMEGKDFVISIPRIKRTVRIGSFLQETIDLYNFKADAVTLTFSVDENLSKYITLDKDKLTIAPKSKGELTFTIFGHEPEGTFNGTILISGSLNDKIEARIDVTNRDLLQINALFLDLEALDKEVHPGQVLRHRTVLRNLLTDTTYPVYLFYSIQDTHGNNSVKVSPENIYLRTTSAIIKKEKLPSDLPPGEYEIKVQATYLDYSSTVNTVFKVTLPFYMYKIFGVLPLWLLGLILLILAILGGIGYWYYKKEQAKKRYHIKVDYNEMPKAGPRNVYVGKISETNNRAYFNLENFKTHTIVAGSTGGGKSFSAQIIIEEMLLHDVAVIVFDPTAQWTGFLRKMDNKSLFALYPLFDMKPSEARAFNGNIREINDPREKIDIKKYMKRGEIQIFACHKLDPKDMDTYVANAIREVFHARFDESRDLRLMIIFDEVHRLLPKFGGSGEGFLQIERGCREFRKWGIGIMMISQVLSDFVGQIKANINTEIQMRTRDEGDLDRIATKYGKDILQSLVKASVGSGMVENPAYNRGQPFFVSFKPVRHSVERLSDEEITKYNNYNDIVDQLTYELDQLEQENGQDVFDLRLELKLSLDKLKGGNFNMVDIYLEGLKPRIEKLWQKLGKTPKKLVREIIADDVLKSELEKAKQSREQFEKEQAAKAATEQKTQAAAAPVAIKKSFQIQLQYKDALVFANGAQVISLFELLDVLPTLDPGVVAKSINDQKNDLEKWVRSKIMSPGLADKLVGKKTKDEIITVLKEEQKNPSPVIEALAVPTQAPQLQPQAPVVQQVQQPQVAQAPVQQVVQAVQTPPPQSVPSLQIPVQETPPPVVERKLTWNEIKPVYESLKTSKEKINFLVEQEKTMPNEANLKFALGVEYHKVNDYRNAEIKYQETLKFLPNNAKVMNYLSIVQNLIKKGDATTAVNGSSNNQAGVAP